MAESRHYGLGNQLDIEQILREAQHRWLCPAEICEILRNYQYFRIASEPANMPSSGSIFLFDRKKLRHFRNDGHNWSKKKEGHEKFKAESIDVLHCYYARGEENEKFQRRSYWMLEEELSHIVLVHYREVKGNRRKFYRIKKTEEAVPLSQETEDILPNSEMDSPVYSSFYPSNYQVPSQTTDTTSLNSAQASEYEGAESDDYQDKLLAISGVDFITFTQADKTKGSSNTGYTDESRKNLDFTHWEDVLGNGTFGSQSVPFQPSFSETQFDSIGVVSKQENEIPEQLFTNTFGKRQELRSHPEVQEEWQTSEDTIYMDQTSKELADVNEMHMQSSSGAYWNVQSENESHMHLDTYDLGPSLSPDQLFSINDFSPNWAYEGSEVKVVITGRFLKNQQEARNCKWSCMFGEVEVPAEVIADGVLRCHSPVQKAACVPFYVTCSNRLACSEVREFEYRVNTSEILRARFGKLLCVSSACPPSSDSTSVSEKSQLSSKISSLLNDDNNDEWDQILKLTSEKDFSPEKGQEKLLEKLLKEMLHVWLLQKVAEGGKGPSVLDEGGQGVLHFAAALGYDWALLPTIVAGVSVNFCDVNGWTALNWAAICGRERTVASLVSLGAAPGALTDPGPKYTSGRTPTDVVSANGHKIMGGYLAESALSTHLSSLELDAKEGDAAQIFGAKAVQTDLERTATPVSDGDLPYVLSLKDSLAAVCNATQAAARIHQVFRVQSFQKKQLKEYDGDTFGISDEKALSLITVKTHKPGQHDEPVHAAAIRIQNKFRSWKGRKEFLIIRQRIVKIQAHVRGHQVRKKYTKIIWSVGILEKVILRWRRKGSGLRGFKVEAQAQALTEGPSMKDTSSKDDDYDFLKEGRKQTEERLQKALARVKSMVQYPDARDQYRRLLNVVNEMQESKAVNDTVVNSSEETADLDDDYIDLQSLLDEDTYMPTAT